MITADRITGVLRERWRELGGAGSPPSRFSFILMTKGREPVGKVVLLAFADAERTPRFAIKLARLKAHAAALEAECLNLRRLARYGADACVVTPRALLYVEEHGEPMLIESVIDGVSLDDARFRVVPIAVVATIAGWLTHLARGPRLAPDGDRRETFPELFRRARRHAATGGERDVLDRLSGRLLAVEADGLPEVFEQRDMGTWNVMVARDGTMGVLDWESSRPRGFPAWDLFYFLAHYGFLADRATTPRARIRSFHGTFFGTRGFGAVARSAVRRYADAVGAPEASLGPLFLGCWLHHALSEATRLGCRLSDSLFWRMLAAGLAGRLNVLDSP